MGAKLKVKNETTHVFTKEKNTTINLTHWRAIREAAYEKIQGLFVICRDFRLYFIPGLTADIFHEANHSNRTLDDCFQYIKNVLSCRHCCGDGKTDWVGAARGDAPKKQQYWYKPNYYRYKKGPVYIMDGHKPPYFVSTSSLHYGEEHCKNCLGSGLEFVCQNKHTITKSITLELS